VSQGIDRSFGSPFASRHPSSGWRVSFFPPRRPSRISTRRKTHDHRVHGPPPARVPAPAIVGDYGEAFPNSRKVYVEGRHGIRVPMREIALSGGEPPLRVYDTSGPLGHDVRQGLPPLRREWIRERDALPVARTYTPIPGRSTAEIPETLMRPTLRGNGAVTQMHYARRGEITRRWSTSRCAKGWTPSSCAPRSRAAGRSSPPTSTTPSSSR
jgi:hypothetical protein